MFSIIDSSSLSLSKQKSKCQVKVIEINVIEINVIEINVIETK